MRGGGSTSRPLSVNSCLFHTAFSVKSGCPCTSCVSIDRSKSSGEEAGAVGRTAFRVSARVDPNHHRHPSQRLSGSTIDIDDVNRGGFWSGARRRRIDADRCSEAITTSLVAACPSHRTGSWPRPLPASLPTRRSQSSHTACSAPGLTYPRRPELLPHRLHSATNPHPEDAHQQSASGREPRLLPIIDLSTFHEPIPHCSCRLPSTRVAAGPT